MNEFQRIIMRIIGVVAIGVGVVGLIHPFKTYDDDSLYHVTTYSRRTGRTISEKDQTGSELMTGQRWGAVAVIACGAFCFFGSRKEKG
jgi:hypothetical protein